MDLVFNGINDNFINEARSVLTAQADVRTETANFSDGECFLLEINKEAIHFLSVYSSTDHPGSTPIMQLHITKTEYDHDAVTLCAIKSNSADINNALNSDTGIHFKKLHANTLLDYVRKEISYVSGELRKCTPAKEDPRKYDMISTAVEQSRDIFYFLSTPSLFRAYSRYTNPNYGVRPNQVDEDILRARDILKKDAEDLKNGCEEALIKELTSAGRFFVKRKDENKPVESEKDMIPFSPETFKTGNKSISAFDKNAFVNKLNCLYALNGCAYQDYIDRYPKEKQEEIKRKLDNSFKYKEPIYPKASMFKSGSPEYTIYFKKEILNEFSYDYDSTLDCILVLNKSKKHYKVNDSIYKAKADLYNAIDVKALGVTESEKSSNTIELRLNKSGKKGIKISIDPSGNKSVCVTDPNAKLVRVRPIEKEMKGQPNPSSPAYAEYSKQLRSVLSPEGFVKVRKLIKGAVASVQSGADAFGIDRTEQHKLMFESVFKKVILYKDTQHKNENEVNAAYLILRNLILTNLANDLPTEANELLEYLDEVTATKYFQLAASTQQTTDASSPAEEYMGDADQFLYDVKTVCPIGQVVSIDLSVKNKKYKESWTKSLAAACNELFGYTPNGQIQAAIAAYSGFRALEARLIRKAGELVDVLPKIIDPNFDLGHNIGDFTANLLSMKPGEVNPKLVDLEEDLRNPGKWLRSNDPLKVHQDREDVAKTYRYQIVDHPVGAEKESKAKEYKKMDAVNRDLNKHLKNFDNNVDVIGRNYESTNYSYLNGFIGINEDFSKKEIKKEYMILEDGAPAGGSMGAAVPISVDAVTPNTQMVSPGTPFGVNMPGSISGMGDPHAPTPEQTPFNGNEKTSAADSGSGDCYTYSVYKKRKKAYSSKLKD